jgi:predicted 3-demethylubiquinone-9 3-methyltransferase (glyoxalase superfamily)
MKLEQRITPFLSLTSQAGEAADYYVSVFPDAQTAQLSEWFASGEPEKIGRMMNSMMQMTKLNIAKLRSAFDGQPDPSETNE